MIPVTYRGEIPYYNTDHKKKFGIAVTKFIDRATWRFTIILFLGEGNVVNKHFDEKPIDHPLDHDIIMESLMILDEIEFPIFERKMLEMDKTYRDPEAIAKLPKGQPDN